MQPYLGDLKFGDFKEWIGLFISKQVKSELGDVHENEEASLLYILTDM